MEIRQEDREILAFGLIVLGAVALFASLFLTWSHQLSRGVLAVPGASAALRGVASDPTAWQVYSAADVVLLLLAAALLTVALVGSRPARIGVFVAAALGFAFVIHAANVPASNGAAGGLPALHIPADLRRAPSPGPGVTVAIFALGVALGGLVLSFTTAD